MPSAVPPGPTTPPGDWWDPETAGLLQDDGTFICGHPIEYGRLCQRKVGEEWSPCWQHDDSSNDSE